MFGEHSAFSCDRRGRTSRTMCAKAESFRPRDSRRVDSDSEGLLRPCRHSQAAFLRGAPHARYDRSSSGVGRVVVRSSTEMPGWTCFEASSILGKWIWKWGMEAGLWIRLRKGRPTIATPPGQIARRAKSSPRPFEARLGKWMPSSRPRLGGANCCACRIPRRLLGATLPGHDRAPRRSWDVEREIRDQRK